MWRTIRRQVRAPGRQAPALRLLQPGSGTGSRAVYPAPGGKGPLKPVPQIRPGSPSLRARYPGSRSLLHNIDGRIAKPPELPCRGSIINAAIEL
jgi:hypothetical protein